MSISDTILRFWAKTSDDPFARPNAFHPLICHLIDVACVAHLMCHKVPPATTKSRITTAFGLDPRLETDIETAGKLTAFIAGLTISANVHHRSSVAGKRIGTEKQISKDSFPNYPIKTSIPAIDLGGITNDRVFATL